MVIEEIFQNIDMVLTLKGNLYLPAFFSESWLTFAMREAGGRPTVEPLMVPPASLKDPSQLAQPPGRAQHHIS